MKRTILILTMLVLAFNGSLAQRLYVGSYNIRYQNDNDVKNGNGWKQRCPVICAQLNFEHPDIFGTQEVLHQQLVDMAALLPDYDYIGVGREDGKSEGEHECIFYDKNRLRLLEYDHFWLSETPEKPGRGWDAACTRICTWGKFRDRKSHRTFFFFNLHMDHVGIVARREGAKLIVNRIRELADDKPVIVTGDFNVDQTNEIYTIFTTSGLLNDSFTEAETRFAKNGTFNAFDPELKTDSRIDHIFVSPLFKVKRYGVLTNGYWVANEQSATKKKGKNAPKEIDFSKHTLRLPSDHYPVFVRLER